MALHWTGGWILASLAMMALGPATARMERRLALPPAVQKPTVRIASAEASAATIPASSAATISASSAVTAQYALSGFEAYKPRLTALARAARVREATIRAVIPYLRLNGRVMELDRAQRPTGRSSSDGYSNFRPYLDRHITGSLIRRGKARYSSHWPNLYRIQSRYGVDPSVIMAIYGKETSYGAITGGFDLLEALASLAYEGRRRALFEQEFIAALRLLDSGVPRSRLEGSYAGATGYPQFMPSVVLRLRADGDGDGYSDIWRSEADAFASIANYLHDAGWKRGVPWGVPVRIPSNLNRAAIRTRLTPTRCPAVFRRHSRFLTVREWRSLGVVPTGRGLPDTELAALMETPGAYAPGYLLTENYRAILEYNCSNYYAMSVGLLANAIAN